MFRSLVLFALLLSPTLFASSAFDPSSCDLSARIAIPHSMETDPKYRRLSAADFQALLARKIMFERARLQREELERDELSFDLIDPATLATLERARPPNASPLHIMGYFGDPAKSFPKELRLVIDAHGAQWGCSRFQELFAAEWVRWGEPPKNRLSNNAAEKDFIWAALNAFPELFDPKYLPGEGAPVLGPEQTKGYLRRARVLLLDKTLPVNFRNMLSQDLRFHEDLGLPANSYFGYLVLALEALQSERNRR